MRHSPGLLAPQMAQVPDWPVLVHHAAWIPERAPHTACVWAGQARHHVQLMSQALHVGPVQHMPRVACGSTLDPGAALEAG